MTHNWIERGVCLIKFFSTVLLFTVLVQSLTTSSHGKYFSDEFKISSVLHSNIISQLYIITLYRIYYDSIYICICIYNLNIF